MPHVKTSRPATVQDDTLVHHLKSRLQAPRTGLVEWGEGVGDDAILIPLVARIDAKVSKIVQDVGTRPMSLMDCA